MDSNRALWGAETQEAYLHSLHLYRSVQIEESSSAASTSQENTDMQAGGEIPNTQSLREESTGCVNPDYISQTHQEIKTESGKAKKGKPALDLS